MPPAGFGDTGDRVHAAAIDCVAWWGVASGASSSTFEPRGTVSRAQMASFLARLIDTAQVRLQQSPPDAFTDDEGSTHEQRINQLAAAGMVRGRAGAHLRAERPTVTRAEMATFLARAHDLVAGAAAGRAPTAFIDDDRLGPRAQHQQGRGHRRRRRHLGHPLRADARRCSAEQMATFLARLLDLLVEGGEVAPALSRTRRLSLEREVEGPGQHARPSGRAGVLA